MIWNKYLRTQEVNLKPQPGAECLSVPESSRASINLLKRADVVLTPDSGPAHLANAVGTPVIGLHACTWPRRSGPYNSQDLCVDKFAEAALQFRNKKLEDLRWGTRIIEKEAMNLIEVDEVIDRLDLAINRLDAG